MALIQGGEVLGPCAAAWKRGKNRWGGDRPGDTYVSLKHSKDLGREEFSAVCSRGIGFSFEKDAAKLQLITRGSLSVYVWFMILILTCCSSPWTCLLPVLPLLTQSYPAGGWGEVNSMKRLTLLSFWFSSSRRQRQGVFFFFLSWPFSHFNRASPSVQELAMPLLLICQRTFPDESHSRCRREPHKCLDMNV